MLIHQGKVLKDATTLEENKVIENSFIVIMMTKVCVFSLVATRRRKKNVGHCCCFVKRDTT